MEDKRFQSRSSGPSGKTERDSEETPRYTDPDLEEMERLLMKLDLLAEIEETHLRLEARPFRL